MSAFETTVDVLERGRETMRATRVLAFLLAGVGAVAAMPRTSSGAFVNWTTPVGSNGLVAWSGGGSTDGLWGDPIINGLTFTFFPDQFRAESSGGGGETVDGLLRFDLDILGGNQITGFRVDEIGSYSILGVGAVQASGVMLITDRDTLQTYTDTLDTAPIFPISNVNPLTGTSGAWSGTMEVTGMANGITRVTIIVDNTLQASSGSASPGNPGGTAFIDKKFANSGVTISIFIPEPSTLGLVFCGAPLLLRRRKS